MTHSNLPDSEARARALVRRYTLLAAGTGAVPLPGASAAIITENAIMIGHVAAVFGVEVTLESVATSLGTVAVLNVGGRTLFVEVMRALNGALGGAATPWVCAFGATTAAVQTWIIGHLTIAIARNHGNPLTKDAAATIASEARSSFDLEELRKAPTPD